MDARAEMALAEMVRSVIGADIDALHARIDALEQSERAFSYSAHVAQRRRAVAELRAEGLSLAAIGRRLGLARATVQRDLDAVPHEPPSHVVGLDGKRQRSRKPARPSA
jgi:DNA-binding NarL/FixJ family response regulator